MKLYNLVIVLIGFIQFAYGQEQPKKFNTSYNNWYYVSRDKLYQALKYKPVDVIFFGDSITERGQWAELIGNKYTIGNRGIGGDNTYGMRARIAYTVQAKPKKIFLMMGINDIGRGIPTDSTLRNYEEIIQIIQKESPKTKIYVQSTLPLNEAKLTVKNQFGKEQYVRNLNAGIVELAKKYNLTFVNLKDVLGQDYILKPEFTNDGIHVNTEAYIEWVKYLKEKKYL